MVTRREILQAATAVAHSNVPGRLADHLGRNPYCTIRGVARRLRVALYHCATGGRILRARWDSDASWGATS